MMDQGRSSSESQRKKSHGWSKSYASGTAKRDCDNGITLDENLVKKYKLSWPMP